MHTSVGHDNSVAMVYSLYVFVDINFWVRERERKNRTMVTQMCRRLPVLFRIFFYFYSFSPVVASCIQGNSGPKKNRRKELVYVYIHIYSFVVTVGVYVCIECEERRKAVKDTTNVSLFAWWYAFSYINDISILYETNPW
jgi:hypothetical protein